MILETITLENIGAFRERVVLGPFAPGLNVLAQPNEWGKSTIFKSLTRALFDKYSAQSEEIKALRPKGSSLSPRVELEFAACGHRWQLRKRFLEGKASELLRWEGSAWLRTDESDKADRRVRELLGAPALEGRAVKPETWGLVRYLWARQDEPADWPQWDGASGDEARRRLATVELDRTVRAIVQRLDEQRAAIFTDTGRPRAKGPLEAAEQEMGRWELEQARLQERHQQTEHLQNAYDRLAGEIVVLEKERATRSEEAAALHAEAEAAERGQEAIRTLTDAFQQADEALQQVRRDFETHARLADEVTALSRKIEEQQRTANRLRAELPGLEAALANVQRETGTARVTRTEHEQTLERLRTILRWRAAADEAAALSAQLDRVDAAQTTLQEIENRRAALPTLTKQRLQSWRELERTMRETTAQIDALGLRVTATPDTSATITVDGQQQPLTGREGTTFKAAQAMTLRLEGWGEIEIRSGAREVGELENTHRSAAQRLAEELRECGLATLAAAENAEQQATELDLQLKPLRRGLVDSLGQQPDRTALAAALTRALAAAEEQRALAPPTEAEAAQSASRLRRDELALALQAKAAAQQVEMLAAAVEQTRAKVESAQRAEAAALAEAATFAARRTGMQQQQELLTNRYRGEPEQALAAAQGAFTQAEARLAEARRQVPAQADKLPARRDRAAKAAAETEAEFGRKTGELRDHEVLLRERGGEGLYSQLATVEEKLETARATAARIREEGWALRLAAEAIKRREQRAIQTVLGPLENRLSAVLADLTGDRTRRVFFDEHLAIRGVGRSADELVPFDDLSRGTREQLLLALRAAIALELSKVEPSCLILDDVLVHTDAVRQQNVLDYLQTLAETVQVVILTCHAERYRGVGHLLAATR